MRLKISFGTPWLGYIALKLSSWLIGTLRMQVDALAPEWNPLDPSCTSRAIYVLWHEYLLFPTRLVEHADFTVLMSQHRDADVLESGCKRMGFDVVRGCTNHGGLAALRHMMKSIKSRHLIITPDGPRGPRREMAIGPVFLASRLKVPLICIGIGYDRPWRLSSWDRFAIPRPYSRARIIFAPPLFVPKDLDRDELSAYCRTAEATLRTVSEQAEAWATTDLRYPEELSTAPPSMNRHAA